MCKGEHRAVYTTRFITGSSEMGGGGRGRGAGLGYSTVDTPHLQASRHTYLGGGRGQAGKPEKNHSVRAAG